MFPIVHLVQMAMTVRKRKRREEAASEERKLVLLRIPHPFAADQRPGRDERAGNDVPGGHADGWRGSDTERIANSRHPYPGT